MRPEPIHVLQLGSPSGLFGAERWILALARHLDRDAVRTTVGVIQDVAGAARAPLLEHAGAMGFETVSIDAPGRLSAAAVPALRALIRERRVQVLHTHFYKSTILGALAVRGTGCALLATPHGWNTDAGPKLQAYEWAERLAFARADVVAPLSPDLERGLRRLPWVRGRLTMVPNGVDLDEVTASQAVAEAVASARAAGEFVVGYVGQLIARKRVDTLIDAFAALSVPARRLFVVGDGPDRAALQARALERGVGDRVVFAGFREDRLDYLRGFDVLVLPSSLEGIPRCLMEAAAAGVAMVASDIDGSRDVVIEAETGRTFPLGDAAALSERLARLHEDPAARRGLAEAGRRHVFANFSARTMADRYTGVFRSCVAGAAPAGGAPGGGMHAEARR